jgi:hypothetical protein
MAKYKNLPDSVVEWCEQEALGQVLSEWNERQYEQVLSGLETENQTILDDIIVWQPFEGQANDWVADQIMSLCKSYLDCAEFALKEGK